MLALTCLIVNPYHISNNWQVFNGYRKKLNVLTYISHKNIEVTDIEITFANQICDYLARTASQFRKAYILPLWFFFRFRRLISEVTERMSTKLGHIFTNDCYLKNLVWTPPGIYPRMGWGQKNAFWDRLWIWLNISLSWNMISYQQLERNLSIVRDSLTCPKFGELWSRNGWERLASCCPPLKCLHWETLPALPHGRYVTDSKLWHVLRSGTSLQSRTTECWAGSRRALPCI